MKSSFSSKTPASKPAILIIGPPGTGKTVLASMLGRPYIIELDNNIAGAFSYLKLAGANCNAKYSVPHIKEDGGVVPRLDRWKAMNADINEAVADPDVDTLVIDGLSALIEIALDEVRRQAILTGDPKAPKIGDPIKGTPDMPLRIQDWGSFGALLRHWFIALRASGKTLVVTGHVVIDKDELTSILQQMINLPGKFAHEISGLFTEVWSTEIREETKDGKKTFKYFITTRPSPAQRSLGLKSGNQLPPAVEVDFAQLNKLIYGH